MEIKLSADYRRDGDLNTVRYANDTCPNCKEPLYMTKDQKEKLTDGLFLSRDELKNYPCTCPNCGAEITLVAYKETVIAFDIEE